MAIFTHLLSQYGYLGLFGLLMFGIIGLPVPEGDVADVRRRPRVPRPP
jgi:hypothetical protein